VEPFKPFITEVEIDEETTEIEDFLKLKNAHNSEDSFHDEISSSEENFNTAHPHTPHQQKQNDKVVEDEEEDVPPEIPPPLPKKTNTMPPKPPILPKPRNLSTRTTKHVPAHPVTLNKGMEDLTLIGKDIDNNIDHGKYAKSTIVANKNDLLNDEDNLSNNNNTFIEHNDQENDEPIQIRPKSKQRVTKTDEEVYAELRNICNMSNPLEKYKKTKEVGKGASGVVFIALDIVTSKEVAIKTIDLKNQSSKELILNEIRVLKDFNHNNLVNFLDAYFLESLDHLWVVLEYMNG
jgi:p21-activated kinase 1